MADRLPARRGLLYGGSGLFGGGLLLTFLYMSSPCDLYLYHQYAQTARARGVAQLYQAHRVEYPPLAVGLILATEELAQRLTVPAALARYNVYKGSDPNFLRFKLAYRLVMAGCTLVTWGLVLSLLRRHFGQETAREWAERLLAFGLCLWPLGYVLFDRLDVVQACLMLLALALLLSRRHYAWSLLVLAAAITFKFVPLVLAPTWVIATLPGSSRRVGRLLADGLVRGGVLVGFVVAFTVPFCLLTGEKCLDFLAFHKERGIEYQSNYAAVLTLLAHRGYPVLAVPGGGSAVLLCPAAPALTRLAGWLVGAGLLAGAAVLLWTRRRPPRPSAGRTDPALILGHTLWALLVLLLFNKAFSPQYLLWLVPLIALVPLSGLRRRLFQLGVIGVAYLTLLIFPRYFKDVLGPALSATPPSWAGATPFATGLLLARLLLLGLLTGLLGQELFRRARVRRPWPG